MKEQIFKKPKSPEKKENLVDGLLNRGQEVMEAIRGIKDSKIAERYLRMFRILSIPIMLSLPSISMSQTESESFDKLFHSSDLQEKSIDIKDKDFKVKLNIAFDGYNKEIDQTAVKSIVNENEKQPQLISYKYRAQGFKAFDDAASQYLNTFSVEQMRFASESSIRANQDIELNPNSEYYFIPKNKVTDFLPSHYYEEEEQINKFNQAYLSEDGNYFIIPKDIQDYNFNEDYAFYYYFNDDEYYENNPDIQREVSEQDIKNNIWVDSKQAENFDISINEMRESVYKMLDIVNKIQITTSDILGENPGPDEVVPSNPSEYFLVNQEKQKEIEQFFIKGLQESSKEFSEGQKLAMLSVLGSIFYRSYNDAIATEGVGGQGEIPLSVLLMAAKASDSYGWNIPAGVCRHINTDLVKIAHQALGFEGFSKSAYSTGLHAIGGLKLENGNICFVDYNNIIKTPTPDIEEATSFYERSVGRIEGRAVVGNKEGSIQREVVSRATKSREEAIHFTDSQDKMEKLINKDKIIKTEDGLVITIENEKQELELNKGYLVLSCVKLDKSGDAFNAIDKLYGVRIASEANFKKLQTHISSFFLSEKIKSLNSEKLPIVKEVGTEVGLDFLHKFNLNKDIYLTLANTLNAYLIYNLNDKAISGFSVNDSYGLKLGYISPSNLNEFHVATKQHLIGSVGNIQTGGIDEDGVRPHIKLTEFDLGAKIQVDKSVKIGVDLGLQKGDIYQGYQLAGNVKTGNFEIGGQFSSKKSRDLLFLPHTKEGYLIISDKEQLFGKECIITVAGGVESKDYGLDKSDQYKFKVGFSMIF